MTANFKIQLNDDEGSTGPFHLLSLAIKDGDPGPTRACYYEWTEVATTLRIAATDRTNVTWGARRCLASLTIRGEPGLGRDGRTSVNGEPLDWWLDRINLLIDMMGDVDLGGAIALDYSAASLSALEAAARDRLADPAEALYDDQQSFTASVVAYLGEALMRVGGGRWDWAAEAPADVTVSDPLVRQRLASIAGVSIAPGNRTQAGFRSSVLTPPPGWRCCRRRICCSRGWRATGVRCG